ncbi:flavodoxin-dependent (E)-4-hydroxy-3-methylbut-2-enyl-diphosphate synthase [Candidatus Sumerlaeota bacterium]|nr:flavodoxin-dependent (E)-4-hydroxy-3-methylbut-2-enyl-diphosphate synthase [Candidatus Sumerlaeota bacterium]
MPPRRPTRQVFLGPVAIGNGAPISVQSMTKTSTADVDATTKQIETLHAAGCEIVRVAVPDQRSAFALAEIVRRSPLPVVADIHFDHRLALQALDSGVAGLRINPGNIGSRDKVEAVVRDAAQRGVPIRIGVNAGSLEKPLSERVERGETTRAEAMVESALGHIRILEALDFRDIKVSLKASDVIATVEAYRLLAGRCDYPFHVGVTEAGTITTGTIKSAAGIGILLMDGLCDTIRVSLSGPPEEEVRVARRLLQAMDERQGEPVVIACPTCGRITIDAASLALEVERILESVHEPIRVAVMGCEVNGPGEAREADIGICGGGGRGILFRKGEIVRRCAESEILAAFREELDALLAERDKE